MLAIAGCKFTKRLASLKLHNLHALPTQSNSTSLTLLILNTELQIFIYCIIHLKEINLKKKKKLHLCFPPGDKMFYVVI